MDADSWGNIIAGAFGAGGAVVGTIGLVQARAARAEAKAANAIAAEANEIAREANAISSKSEQRAAERHDAKWEGRWVRPGVYVLRNVGTSSTQAGRIRVSVDEEEQTATFEALEPGVDFELNFPGARRTYEQEQDEERDYERRLAESQQPRVSSIGSIFAPSFVEPPKLLPSHFIEWRVVWTTELGTHKEQEDRQPMTSLGPE